MGEDYASVAKQFIESYYSTANTNLPGIGSLYRESSVLTSSSDVVVGPAAIVEYLGSNLYLGDGLEHALHTFSAAPLAGGTIVVLATGALTWPDGRSPLLFAETFVLMQDGGSYYVARDIFDLVDVAYSDTHRAD
ncbi:nuclear transport factor 2 family protein [Nonomuraea sp. NPDC003707]